MRMHINTQQGDKSCPWKSVEFLHYIIIILRVLLHDIYSLHYDTKCNIL